MNARYCPWAAVNLGMRASTGLDTIVRECSAPRRDGGEGWMNVRYVVELTPKERSDLAAFVASGTPRARKLKRAQVLLAVESGVTDMTIAATIGVSTATIYRTKRRFVERGVEHALNDDPRPGAGRKLSGKDEALLVAVACSQPPEGRARWTLELLAGEVVRLTEHEQLSRETVRRRLHEKAIKPWQKKMWC